MNLFQIHNLKKEIDGLNTIFLFGHTHYQNTESDPVYSWVSLNNLCRVTFKNFLKLILEYGEIYEIHHPGEEDDFVYFVNFALSEEKMFLSDEKMFCLWHNGDEFLLFNKFSEDGMRPDMNFLYAKGLNSIFSIISGLNHEINSKIE